MSYYPYWRRRRRYWATRWSSGPYGWGVFAGPTLILALLLALGSRWPWFASPPTSPIAIALLTPPGLYGAILGLGVLALGAQFLHYFARRVAMSVLGLAFLLLALRLLPLFPL